MDYYCKECGLAVIVLKDGTIIRACNHTSAIIAGMSAVTSGVSVIKHA